MIKHHLDQKEILIISLEFSTYADSDNPDDISFHAVAVVGYKVGSDGRMNVEVSDSNRHLNWMSVEHFSRSLHGGMTIAVGRE
jgi:hypothetical protein